MKRILVLLSITPTLLWAAASPAQPWQFFAGVGYLNYLKGSENQTVSISYPNMDLTENDLLNQTNQSPSVNYLLGFQRRFVFNNKILPAITLGPVAVYQPTTLSGEIWRYGNSANATANYQVTIKPVSGFLESDFYLPYFAKKRLEPYVFAGAGFISGTINYKETLNPNYPSEALFSPTSNYFFRGAFETGAGMQLNLTKHLFSMVRYSYDYSGNTNWINTNATSIRTLHFNLNTQSVTFMMGASF